VDQIVETAIDARVGTSEVFRTVVVRSVSHQACCRGMPQLPISSWREFRRRVNA
jgi:hypothetical protein